MYFRKLVKESGTTEEDFGVYFSNNVLNFQCNYPRTIETNSSFESTSLQSHDLHLSLNDNLEYTMSVNVDESEGRTQVTCEPNHNLAIYPR